MIYTLIILTAIIFISSMMSAAQTVTVSPHNITAYSQGATTAYLTFSNVTNLRPAETDWCGEIISAAHNLDFRCDTATIFGTLPARYDQSRLNGINRKHKNLPYRN